MSSRHRIPSAVRKGDGCRFPLVAPEILIGSFGGPPHGTPSAAGIITLNIPVFQLEQLFSPASSKRSEQEVPLRERRHRRSRDVDDEIGGPVAVGIALDQPVAVAEDCPASGPEGAC
jgi:hypothetical protein